MAKNKIKKDKKSQKEKPAEVKEIKKKPSIKNAKSFLDLESINLENPRENGAPVLEKSWETQPTLESAVSEAKTEKKEEEKPFKYSGQSKYEESKKYEDKAVQEQFANEGERTFREIRRNIPPAEDRASVEWMPGKKEKPVRMIQENSGRGFSEEVMKYEHEEEPQDSFMHPKLHDSKKDVKKYKMKSGY